MGGIVSSIFGGGSSGGGTAANTSPTSQNITTSNIAPWAQSGVSDLINAGMGQVFQTNPDGSINTNAIKGYTPFNANTPAGQEWVQGAAGSVAGFSPLQQQAQQNIANMQVPGQYGQAMDMSTLSGLGSLGTTGQAMGYGQTGQAAGLVGMGQGLSYGQNATNPNTVAAYMNPYLQNTLSPALQLQNQQFGQINAQNQGQATQQGAFGGGRQAVMQGLNQQNQMLAQNQLVGNAYNQAYNTANQNMQTASQLGMQGAGLGISGANAGLAGVGAQQAGYGQLGSQGTNLANIAGAQTQQGLNINAAQQAAGALQQQNQQNILNQAMANYNTAQTYPMTQLAQLESMYTGAPQNITSSTYSAAPSTTSQLAGLGTAAIGASKLMAKEGGQVKVKNMATGGIASGVPAPKLDAMLGRLDDQQLAQKADPRNSDPQTAQAALSQQAFRAQMRPAGIGSSYNFNAAGGGIVAFADGGDIKSVLMQDYKTPIEEQIAQNKAMMPNTDFAKKYSGILDQVGYDMGADKSQAQGLRLLQAGLGIMGGTSPFAAANIGQGSQAALAGYGEDVKDMKRQQMDLAKQQFELGKFGYNSEADIVKAVQADRKGTRDDLVKILGSETAADAAIKSAQIHAGATVAAAGISAEKAGLKEREGIKTEFEALVAQGYDANSPITKQLAQQNYLAATRPYGASSMMSAFGQQLAKDGEIKALNLQLTMAQAGGDKKAADEIQQKIAARTKILQSEFQQQAASMKPGTPAPVVPTPIPQPVAPTTPKMNGSIVQNKDGTFNYVPNQ